MMAAIKYHSDRSRFNLVSIVFFFDFWIYRSVSAAVLFVSFLFLSARSSTSFHPPLPLYSICVTFCFPPILPFSSSFFSCVFLKFLIFHVKFTERQHFFGYERQHFFIRPNVALQLTETKLRSPYKHSLWQAVANDTVRISFWFVKFVNRRISTPPSMRYSIASTCILYEKKTNSLFFPVQFLSLISSVHDFTTISGNKQTVFKSIF